MSNEQNKFKFTIITPLFEKYNEYIEECYNSFSEQRNWEWIIVINNGGVVPNNIRQDSRVRVLQLETNKVGELKAFAAKHSSGDVIVELDADDMLTEYCLLELNRAFLDDQIVMAYSNSASFNEN